MSKADIDDTECGVFMKCLSKNTSLTTLDISHNLIGKEESRNCVEPDFYTGGEAIADMIQTNKTITCVLHVSVFSYFLLFFNFLHGVANDR